jgi:hypothetical protein
MKAGRKRKWKTLSVFFENCTEEEKTAGKTPRVQNESFVSKKSSEEYYRKMIQT